MNGRQIKKSLKTDDYQLAKRKLRELEKDYHERTGIVGSEPLPKSFKELVVKFTRIVLPTRPLKPLAKLDYLTRQTALLRYTGFAKLPLNRITMIDCQKWFTDIVSIVPAVG